MAQTDQLFESLTVREAVTYASQLYNAKRECKKETRSSIEVVAGAMSIDDGDNKKLCDTHTLITSNVLRKLGLDVCADTRISGVRLSALIVFAS